MTMTAVLTDFARSLARHGYPADPGRLHTAVTGLSALGTIERRHVYTVTRAAWCTTAEQWADFSIHFERFFSRHPAAAPPPDIDVEIDVPDALPGDDDTETGDPEPRAAAASKAAVLRETDIAELLGSDAADARAQLAGLRLHPPQRRRTRCRRGRADRLHVRQALRELLATGEITSLPGQERRAVPRPIVLVLDVSASMKPFHAALLAFAAAASTNSPQRQAVPAACASGSCGLTRELGEPAGSLRSAASARSARTSTRCCPAPPSPTTSGAPQPSRGERHARHRLRYPRPAHR